MRFDRDAGAISETEMSGLDSLLAVRETMPFALEQLRDVAVDLPQITPALDRLEARVTALQARGVDVDRLDFEASLV